MMGDERGGEEQQRAGLMGDGERNRHDEEQGRDAERELQQPGGEQRIDASRLRGGRSSRRVAAQKARTEASTVIARMRWSNCTEATFSKSCATTAGAGDSPPARSARPSAGRCCR